MQQTDIDLYSTNLLNLLNTDVTTNTHSQIQTNITTVENNRTTMLASQSATEQNDNIINICRNEDYNKIIMYGTLSKSYFEYYNKISFESDVTIKSQLIEEQQLLKSTLCGFITNDDYLTNFAHLVKFINNRSS